MCLICTVISREEKESLYQNVRQQFEGLLEADLPFDAHLNNLCALLKKEFQFFWIGFYKTINPTTLQIGPYQGEVPCFTITYGKGVCGTAASSGQTQRVDDVYAFPGYIACHPEPNSEIVIPGMKNGECLFVLDVDHVEKAYFDDVDQQHLEELVGVVIDKKCA